MRKVKDVNTWRDIPGSGIGKPNIVKEPILPQLLSKFNTLCIKIQGRFFFVDIGKIVLKCTSKGKINIKLKQFCNSQNSTVKGTKICIRKWAKEMNRNFTG